MKNTMSILTQDGSDAGSLDIKPAWVELEKGAQAVHDEVVRFLAAQRRGTASTKRIGDVRGGGQKPYRQKGTGRARAGSVRSPLWRGGAVTFGPRPRTFKKKLNKKTRKLALKRAFSERMNEGAVIVVDELTIAEPRTKQMNAFLDAVDAGDDALVIVDEPSRELLLASRNLPAVEVIRAATVNTYWMLLYDKVVFTKAGLDTFVKRISHEEVEA